MKTNKKFGIKRIFPILLLVAFCGTAVAVLIPRTPRAPETVDNIEELETYLNKLTAAVN